MSEDDNDSVSMDDGDRDEGTPSIQPQAQVNINPIRAFQPPQLPVMQLSMPSMQMSAPTLTMPPSLLLPLPQVDSNQPQAAPGAAVPLTAVQQAYQLHSVVPVAKQKEYLSLFPEVKPNTRLSFLELFGNIDLAARKRKLAAVTKKYKFAETPYIPPNKDKKATTALILDDVVSSNVEQALKSWRPPSLPLSGPLGQVDASSTEEKPKEEEKFHFGFDRQVVVSDAISYSNHDQKLLESNPLVYDGMAVDDWEHRFITEESAPVQAVAEEQHDEAMDVVQQVPVDYVEQPNEMAQQPNEMVQQPNEMCTDQRNDNMVDIQNEMMVTEQAHEHEPGPDDIIGIDSVIGVDAPVPMGVPPVIEDEVVHRDIEFQPELPEGDVIADYTGPEEIAVPSTANLIPTWQEEQEWTDWAPIDPTVSAESSRLHLDMNDVLSCGGFQASRLGALQSDESDTVRGPSHPSGSDMYNVSNDQHYKKVATAASAKRPVFGTTLLHTPFACMLMPPYFSSRLEGKELLHIHKPALKLSIDETYPISIITDAIAHSGIVSGMGDSDEVGVLKSVDDISASTGNIVCMEYVEENPVLVNNAGMATHIKTYVKKKAADDVPTIKPPADGDVVILGPDDPSPFRIGKIEPGQVIMSVENNMFRAPMAPHSWSGNDFLLVRKASKEMKTQLEKFISSDEDNLDADIGIGGGDDEDEEQSDDNYNIDDGGRPLLTAQYLDKRTEQFEVRSVDGLYLVGQEQPIIEVPAPASRLSNLICRHWTLAVIYRYMRRHNGMVTTMDILRHHKFLTGSSIRRLLKDICDMQKFNQSSVWIKKTTVPMPSEQELMHMCTPEQACSFQSMLLGKERMNNAGVHFFIARTAVRTALTNVPFDESKLLQMGSRIDEIVASAPWTVSFNLLQAVKMMRGNTMKGHPFPDLLRTTTQTGTAARAEQGRWSVRDARLVLIALGIPEERLQQQLRWQNISLAKKLVKDLQTSGNHLDLSKLTNNAERFTFTASQLNEYMQLFNDTFDEQVQFMTDRKWPEGIGNRGTDVIDPETGQIIDKQGPTDVNDNVAGEEMHAEDEDVDLRDFAADLENIVEIPANLQHNDTSGVLGSGPAIDGIRDNIREAMENADEEEELRRFRAELAEESKGPDGANLNPNPADDEKEKKKDDDEEEEVIRHVGRKGKAKWDIVPFQTIPEEFQFGKRYYLKRTVLRLLSRNRELVKVDYMKNPQRVSAFIRSEGNIYRPVGYTPRGGWRGRKRGDGDEASVEGEAVPRPRRGRPPRRQREVKEKVVVDEDDDGEAVPEVIAEQDIKRPKRARKQRVQPEADDVEIVEEPEEDYEGLQLSFNLAEPAPGEEDMSVAILAPSEEIKPPKPKAPKKKRSAPKYDDEEAFLDEPIEEADDANDGDFAPRVAVGGSGRRRRHGAPPSSSKRRRRRRTDYDEDDEDEELDIEDIDDNEENEVLPTVTFNLEEEEDDDEDDMTHMKISFEPLDEEAARQAEEELNMPIYIPEIPSPIPEPIQPKKKPKKTKKVSFGAPVIHDIQTDQPPAVIQYEPEPEVYEPLAFTITIPEPEPEPEPVQPLVISLIEPEPEPVIRTTPKRARTKRRYDESDSEEEAQMSVSIGSVNGDEHEAVSVVVEMDPPVMATIQYAPILIRLPVPRLVMTLYMDDGELCVRLKHDIPPPPVVAPVPVSMPMSMPVIPPMPIKSTAIAGLGGFTLEPIEMDMHGEMHDDDVHHEYTFSLPTFKIQQDDEDYSNALIPVTDKTVPVTLNMPSSLIVRPWLSSVKLCADFGPSARKLMVRLPVEKSMPFVVTFEL